MEPEWIVIEQTTEQAATAISEALEFLRRETAAIGMVDVSEAIARVRTMADEYRGPKSN